MFYQQTEVMICEEDDGFGVYEDGVFSSKHDRLEDAEAAAWDLIYACVVGPEPPDGGPLFMNARGDIFEWDDDLDC